MLHALYFLSGMTGMSVCLWTLGDLFRVVVLQCMWTSYKMRQRILTSYWAESHTKMMLKMSSVDICVEDFQEIFIEVVEPFTE